MSRVEGRHRRGVADRGVAPPRVARGWRLHDGELFIQRLIGGADLTPIQWADLHRSAEFSPEKKLALAVLTDAILVVGRGNSTRKGAAITRREAIDWVFADDWQYSYSFLNICETLNISVDATRTALVVTGLASTKRTNRPHHKTKQPTEIRRHAR